MVYVKEQGCSVRCQRIALPLAGRCTRSEGVHSEVLSPNRLTLRQCSLSDCLHEGDVPLFILGDHHNDVTYFSTDSCLERASELYHTEALAATDTS